MRKMATAFNTTVAALEDELTQLILEGLINARIDSHSKVSASEPLNSCTKIRNSPFWNTLKLHSSVVTGMFSRAELCVNSESMIPWVCSLVQKGILL